MNKLQKSEATRHTILATTYELLLESRQLTVRNISKQSGLSIGILYYHFADLNAILNEVIHLHFSTIYKRAAELGDFKNHLHKIVIGEALVTLYAKSEPDVSMFFLLRPPSFDNQHVQDFKKILDEFNATYTNDDLILHSTLFSNMISGVKHIFLSNQTNISAVDSILYVSKQVFSAFNIDECYIEEIKEPLISIAKNMKYIDVVPHWLQERFANNPVYQRYLIEKD